MASGGSRVKWRAVVILLGAASSLGCRKTDDRARAEPVQASADTKKAPAPSLLPVCGTDDPLSALCSIGTDSARFECQNPEPVQFCSRGTEWHCRRSPGTEPPPVSYRARYDQQGPRLKGGDTIDVSKFKREGKVRGVAVQLAVSDEKIAKVRQDEIASKLAVWGCKVSPDPRLGATTFSCGTWQAKLRYSAVVHLVFLEAAENGFLECQ